MFVLLETISSKTHSSFLLPSSTDQLVYRSELRQEAVELRDDVVAVVAVDEALGAVVHEPAVDVGAPPLITAVVLLPAPKATPTATR